MITAQELINRVKFQMKVPLDDDTTFTDEEMISYLNEALRQIGVKGYIKETTSIEIEAGKRKYDMNTTLQDAYGEDVETIREHVSIEFAILEGQQHALQPFDTKAVAKYGLMGQTSQPEFFKEEGNFILLYPAPSSDYILDIYRSVQPRFVEAIEDVIVDIPTNFIDAIPMYILFKCKSREEEWDSAKQALALHSQYMNQAISTETSKENRAFGKRVQNVYSNSGSNVTKNGFLINR